MITKTKLNNFIKKFEISNNCKVICAFFVGSCASKTANELSDLDLMIITDSKTLFDSIDGVDVWAYSLMNVLQGDLFLNVRNINILDDNVAYETNNSISSFISENRQGLLTEIIDLVYDNIRNNIRMLSLIREDEFNSKRRYRSMMFDTLYCCYVIKNYIDNNPVFTINSGKQSILYRIRGKRGYEKLSYAESFNQLIKAYNYISTDFHESSKNKSTLNEFYELIGDSMNSNLYINRYKLLLNMIDNKDISRDICYDDSSFELSSDNMQFINNYNTALKRDFDKLPDVYFDNLKLITELFNMTSYVPNEFIDLCKTFYYKHISNSETTDDWKELLNGVNSLSDSSYKLSISVWILELIYKSNKIIYLEDDVRKLIDYIGDTKVVYKLLVF